MFGHVLQCFSVSHHNGNAMQLANCNRVWNWANAYRHQWRRQQAEQWPELELFNSLL